MEYQLRGSDPSPHAIHAEDVRLFFNIQPEAARYLADRDLADIARSTVFNTRPDALCVSGLTAGAGEDFAAGAAYRQGGRAGTCWCLPAWAGGWIMSPSNCLWRTDEYHRHHLQLRPLHLE